MTNCYHNPKDLLRTFSEYFIKSFLLALIPGCCLLFSACEGDATFVGGKLLPASDFVSVKSTDTINVRSYTMYTDSIESDNPSISYLGSIYDPYFGTTTAEFVSQIRLAASWTATNYIIDSVKLHLELLNVSGEVYQTPTLVMSEIDQQIYDTATYYSNQSIPLTGMSWTVDLPDSLKADTVNSFTVNVPVQFGEYVARNSDMLFHSNTVPDFRSYFKGIHFQLESAQPIFMALSVAPSSSGYNNYFIFYLKDISGNPLPPFTFALDAVSRNAAFNRYIHNFNTAEPGKKISHINDTTALDTLSYAQRMNGVYTRIVIPGLADFKKNQSMKGISVNKARLVFPVVYDAGNYKSTTIPSQIFMRYVKKDGTRQYVHDLQLISSLFYDGTSDTTASVYRINIPTFVQKYLEDDADELKPELELFLPPSASNNVILKANHSHSPVRFEFAWTKF